MILQIVLIALALIIIVMLIKQRNGREKKEESMPLILDVEIKEDEVTPTLIQTLLLCNLAMKRKLIAISEDGNMDECVRLQNQVIQNYKFIVDLFEYDKKLKEKMQVGSKSNENMKENDIPLFKEGIGKQRLDVRIE